MSDGENYAVLLNQLKPDECSRAPLQTKDLHQRAEQVSFSIIVLPFSLQGRAFLRLVHNSTDTRLSLLSLNSFLSLPGPPKR